MDKPKKDSEAVPPIVTTYRLARQTFDHKAVFDISSNISKLKRAMDGLRAEDLGLDTQLMDPEAWIDPAGPKYKVIHVFEDVEVNMFVLVLRPGFKLPLHDHPQMHGLLKVISGTARIVSYSKFSKGEKSDLNFTILAKHKVARLTQGMQKRMVFARMSQNGVFGVDDETCVLTPTVSNFHEIKALETPVAFLDILAPPYDTIIDGIGPITCRYYKVANKYSGDVVELREAAAPDFYTAQAPYLGPKLF